jgi:hypothetical protein
MVDESTFLVLQVIELWAFAHLHTPFGRIFYKKALAQRYYLMNG